MDLTLLLVRPVLDRVGRDRVDLRGEGMQLVDLRLERVRKAHLVPERILRFLVATPVLRRRAGRALRIAIAARPAERASREGGDFWLAKPVL